MSDEYAGPGLGEPGVFRVQAQLVGTTQDGWESSRQVKTMYVMGNNVCQAVQDVSDVAWDATTGRMVSRYTMATAVRVTLGTGDPVGPMVWVRVDYSPWGISTRTADTYAELSESAWKHADAWKGRE